jgi:hypothetical protein
MPLTLQISAQSVPSQSGQHGGVGPFYLVGTTSFDEVDTKQLANGDNVFTLPTAPGPPVGCVIDPPNSNLNVLKLKGAGADTGIVISKTAPTVLTFDPANLPVSFIINSAGAMAAGSVLVVTWF